MKKITDRTVRLYGKVKTAIRRGVLVRGQCRCGSSKLAYAHHYDYATPLDVDWLCMKCHMNRHHSSIKYLENPEMFQLDSERKKEIEIVWEQSIHVIENESYIRGRLATAIC